MGSKSGKKGKRGKKAFLPLLPFLPLLLQLGSLIAHLERPSARAETFWNFRNT
jgi:hypothetical protein